MIQREKQRGVTLLLAILILAAISAIVFSIATIAINEIKSSNDLATSEPIIKADEAIAEDGLYKLVRGYSALPDCSTINSTPVGPVNVSTCASYYYSNPYNFNLGVNVQRDFFLYNPINQAQNPGYTALTVQIKAGSNGTLYFCLISVPNCVATPTMTQSLSMNGTTVWNSGALDTTQKYQLTIINGASSSASYSVTANPWGLPAGTTTIINQGSSRGSTRSLQVDVPQ